jgi:hypothetical protein
MKSGRAGGWYTGSVREAMALARMMHPEMRDSPHLDAAYKLALATTSQGERVWPNNVKYADRAFDSFKRTGQFPTNLDYQNKDQVNGNFAKLNALFGQDPERALKFLHSEFTVGELGKMGFKVSGENKDTKVYGSAILGAKIGNGFYQNLHGNYNPTTFDLWWMRGWNRLTGNLVGQQDPEGAERTKQRYVKSLGELAQADPEMLHAMATRDMDQHEYDFNRWRSQFDAGIRGKSERTLAADRYLTSRAGINEQPTSGSQRTWMRGVATKARGILAKHGHDITNADLQALWWYPEKDLYGHLGARDSESLNVDYSTALQRLAKEKGFSDAAIQQALATAR